MSKNDFNGKRDGGWDWFSKANSAKILEAIEEFNKTTPKVSLVHNGSLTSKKPKKPTNIGCQFSAIPREGGSKKKQTKVGLNDCQWTLAGLERAKEQARKISLKLQHNEFTWDWYDEYVKGHKPVDELAVLLSTPIQVWIDKLYATKKGQIKESSWQHSYQAYFNRFNGKLQRKPKEATKAYGLRIIEAAKKYNQSPLTEKALRNCIEATKPNSNTRKTCIAALTNLLKVADLYDHFKKVLDSYSSNNKPVHQVKDVPSDKRIKEVYHKEFPAKAKRKYRGWQNLPHWKWLYGLLATYGLRIHEAWNIANWDKPVKAEGGQWVEGEGDELVWVPGDDLVILAYNDPRNTDGVLAIKHTTKTGYRLAYPLSPAGEDWVTEFDLKGEMRLPVMSNPFYVNANTGGEEYYCTKATCRKFAEKKLGFSPHCLRYAYNHRGRLLGMSIPALAKSLGHNEQTNSTTYAKHMSITTTKKLLDKEFRAAKTKAINNQFTITELKEQAEVFAENDINFLQKFNQFLEFLSDSL